MLIGWKIITSFPKERQLNYSGVTLALMETFPLFSISSLNNSLLSVPCASYYLSVVMDCLLFLQFSHPHFFFKNVLYLKVFLSFGF